jgi:hypothetical protein
VRQQRVARDVEGFSGHRAFDAFHYGCALVDIVTILPNES